MNNPVHISAVLIDIQMACSIRRRLAFSLYNFPIAGQNNQLVLIQLRVRYTARFYHDQTGFWISGADISARQTNQIVLWEFLQ